MRNHIHSWTRLGGNLLQDKKKKIVIYAMYVIPYISNRILDFFWELLSFVSGDVDSNRILALLNLRVVFVYTAISTGFYTSGTNFRSRPKFLFFDFSFLELFIPHQCPSYQPLITFVISSASLMSQIDGQLIFLFTIELYESGPTERSRWETNN